MNGGYSVLYHLQAYNVVTKLNADITLTNQFFSTVDYAYIVNGQTFTGSY
jgi:hypothetical protein